MTPRARRLALAVAVVAASGVTIGLAAAPVAATPQCDGLPATIVGTEDSDLLDGTPGDDVIVGLNGFDVIYGEGGNDHLCGGLGADFVSGGPGDDFVSGGPGGNLITGDAGADDLHGGPDPDGVSYSGAPAGVTVNLLAGRASGGDGPDTLSGLDNVFGSDYDDDITGNGETNLLLAFGGDNNVDGRGGDFDQVGYLCSGGVIANLAGGTAVHLDRFPSTACPGEIGGEDTLANIEAISGSDFDDSLTDSLTGDSGPNGLFGGRGDDTLFGKGGDDLLTGDAGHNTLNGGSGESDMADYGLSAPTGVRVDLSTRQGRVGNTETDAFQSIEAVNGSPYPDRLIGDDADNIFIGNGGDDRIDGRRGRDTVAYEFTVRPGAEIVPIGGPARVDLAAGTAWNDADTNQVNGDRLQRIEDVIGSPRDDVLRGDDHPNLVIADAGDDVIEGRGGDDTFFPDAGSDRVDGGRGAGDAALFSGGPGIRADLGAGTVKAGSDLDRLTRMDIVAGSSRHDRMLGSRRNDILVGAEARDNLRGRDGNDVLVGGGLGNPDHLANRLIGGPGRDSCLGGNRRGCESRSLPPRLRDELRQARAQAKRAPRLRRGARRRNY